MPARAFTPRSAIGRFIRSMVGCMGVSRQKSGAGAIFRCLSQRLHERVVVGMRTDPKPRDRVVIDSSEGPPADTDSDGPHVGRTYLLECQTRIPEIIEPESIVLAGGLPDVVGRRFRQASNSSSSFDFTGRRSACRGFGQSESWPEPFRQAARSRAARQRMPPPSGCRHRSCLPQESNGVNSQTHFHQGRPTRKLGDRSEFQKLAPVPSFDQFRDQRARRWRKSE